MEKPDPYHPSLPHIVTINRFLVLLSPLLPHTGRGYLPYSSPTQYMLIIQPANDLQDPSHSLYSGYKSGLRTPIQHWISLELAHCSNSVSHSNKLYSPLILLPVWKFFSNPDMDHDSGAKI